MVRLRDACWCPSTVSAMAFGHLPLLESAALQLDAKERLAVIGRNGTGKSTLLKIVSGEIQPDSGTVWRQPGLKIASLEQDVPLSSSRSVFDVVAEGHTHHLDDDDERLREHHVDLMLSRLDAAGRRDRRHVVRRLAAPRAAGARAGRAARCPAARRADQPSRHRRDHAGSKLVRRVRTGAVVFVTHDRAFLQRLATRIVELDRGQLTSWPGDYATYLRRKEEALAGEAAERERFDKKLAEEEVWLRQGIKARRTRNEGRVRALMAMRDERAPGASRSAQRAAVRSSRPSSPASWCSKPKAIVEALGDPPRTIVGGISRRAIMRGDRIGLIGPNGAGKTTLLRLLLGELTPDAGEVAARRERRRSPTTISSASSSTPSAPCSTRSAKATTPSRRTGGPRHVHAYLSDFLFSRRARRLAGEGAVGRRTQSPAAGAACSRVRPTCWCSTSRPTTSTSKRWSCSKSSLPAGRGRCCS